MDEQDKTKRKNRKAIASFLRFMGTLLVIAVLAVLLPLSIPNFIGYQTYNVISGSMEPTIPIGSLILVKPAEGKDIEVDDIVAFYNNGIVVTHRVTYNNSFEGTITTKGDANVSEDVRKTKYGEIIGKVEHHYPYLGSLGAYVSTVSGKLLFFEIICIGALLHIIAGRVYQED